jgi:hypothetical protein
MGVHSVDGFTVEVSVRSVNLFFYRSMGVSVKVSPKRHWYCLWLCTSERNVDRLECLIRLDGIAGEAENSGSCTECGILTVMGPPFVGFNFGAPYSRVSYSGTVRVRGANHPITGSLVYP